MKKLLLLLLLLFLFSLSGYSQYSKKELKAFKKLDVKIKNKGLDLTATFVCIAESAVWASSLEFQTRVNSALFTNNLEVGDYFYVQETNKNVINGRYLINIGPLYKSFIIKDLKTNKMVANISVSKWNIWSEASQYKIDYIFKKLIESNK